MPGGEKQLAEDGAGPLRFLKNLACFVRIAKGIAAQEKPLSVTKSAGKRIAEFVSDAGDHLPETGELLRLQQLGLKDALCGEVSIDLDASQECAALVKDWPRSALQQARYRAHQIQLFADSAFAAAIRTTPALSKTAWLSRAFTERRNKIIVSRDGPKLLRR
jgi:hypothetical protein